MELEELAELPEPVDLRYPDRLVENGKIGARSFYGSLCP